MSDAVKLLFVCSQNRWRSLTAERIFSGIPGYAVKSAGTENNARIKVNEGHVGWADIIFVMEKKHLHRLQSKFSDASRDKQIICLHIPDDFNLLDPDLVELLKARVSEHIDLPD